MDVFCCSHSISETLKESYLHGYDTVIELLFITCWHLIQYIFMNDSIYSDGTVNALEVSLFLWTFIMNSHIQPKRTQNEMCECIVFSCHSANGKDSVACLLLN